MYNAQPTQSSAAASTHGAATHALELLEARQLRDALRQLLRREQAAMADFLIALADFDRRRSWEALGHANLFAFLHVELRLSRSAAFYRKSAAELLQRFPEVIEPLRDGWLCLSTIAELAKVLTDDNREVVMPRFFGLSSREAQELVAELQPRPVPSTRMVVTGPLSRPAPSVARTSLALLAHAPAPPADADPNVVPLSRVLTSEFANGGGADAGFDRPAIKRDEIVPLTAEIRRVHFNVSKQVVQKLVAAREGLSHAIPGATMEQVLEAALDLLLEKQARARGMVKRPRRVLPAALRPKAPLVTEGQTTPSGNCSVARPEGRAVRRTGPREPIPAAVRRAVWERDAGRCSWPLDGGGCCGSTHRLELDHIVPWAEGGPSTVENLRVVCGRHNTLAARRAFGDACVRRYATAVAGAGASHDRSLR
jgi:hypothetical protein